MLRKLLPLATCVLALGCAETERPSDEDAADAPSARNVEISEDSQRLAGIETQIVESVTVAGTREMVGWLTVPPGREVDVKAPATGFVRLPKLQLGAAVAAGDELGKLHVFLSPQEEAQVVALKEEADILLHQAQVTLDLTERQLSNLKGATDVVAGIRIQELEERARKARVAVREAKEKLQFLPPEPYKLPLQLKPVDLHAPVKGRVVRLEVADGQLVVAGDPLATIGDWSELWCRIPVFNADLVSFDTAQPASAAAAGEPRVATYVPNPVPLEPGRRTVDLYYAVANEDGKLRSGEPMSLNLPLAASQQAILIPASAVLWDSWGDGWVYVRNRTTSFTRRRIELHTSPGGRYRVTRGLAAGDEVVVQGAATLFAEQFKGQIQAGEDDD